MLVVRRAILRHSRLLCARRTYASASEPEPDYDLDNYPKLPDVSRQYLSPYGWQDPQDRRNFGETVSDLRIFYFTAHWLSAPRARRALFDVGP